MLLEKIFFLENMFKNRRILVLFVSTPTRGKLEKALEREIGDGIAVRKMSEPKIHVGALEWKKKGGVRKRAF